MLDDRENIPSIGNTTSSNKNSPKITSGTNKPKITTTPLSASSKKQSKQKEEEQEQQEFPIILDEDSNGRENVEGFLSCASSSFTGSPASPQFSLKRRRIIFSSDEEDDDYQKQAKTERKLRKNEKINDGEIVDKEFYRDEKVESNNKTVILYIPYSLKNKARGLFFQYDSQWFYFRENTVILNI